MRRMNNRKKEIENNSTAKKKNRYNRKKYERQRKSFEENTKKEKENAKEIKAESECILLSKWKIQQWRQFLSCEEKEKMNEKEDQKKGEKNWDNYIFSSKKTKRNEHKDIKKTRKTHTHLKRRRFWKKKKIDVHKQHVNNKKKRTNEREKTDEQRNTQKKETRDKQKDGKRDGLMQRLTRGRCPCHCDHRTNNYQRERGGEKSVPSEKHKFLPTKLQKWFFVTMECRNLFCFCYQRNWESKEEICTTESPNKDFDHENEIICYHSCQRKRTRYWDKGEFQKICYKNLKEKRR